MGCKISLKNPLSILVAILSYSTIVLYSRNHKGVGVAHKKTSPKNQPQFILTTMRQYWLGKTKPKQVDLSQLCFENCLVCF